MSYQYRRSSASLIGAATSPPTDALEPHVSAVHSWAVVGVRYGEPLHVRACLGPLALPPACRRRRRALLPLCQGGPRQFSAALTHACRCSPALHVRACPGPSRFLLRAEDDGVLFYLCAKVDHGGSWLRSRALAARLPAPALALAGIDAQWRDKAWGAGGGRRLAIRRYDGPWTREFTAQMRALSTSPFPLRT